jgi:hypothetical protein
LWIIKPAQTLGNHESACNLKVAMGGGFREYISETLVCIEFQKNQGLISAHSYLPLKAERHDIAALQRLQVGFG